MTSIEINARPTRAAAIALLRAAELPTEDLADERLEHFFLAGDRASRSVSSDWNCTAAMHCCDRWSCGRSRAPPASDRGS